MEKLYLLKLTNLQVNEPNYSLLSDFCDLEITYDPSFFDILVSLNGLRIDYKNNRSEFEKRIECIKHSFLTVNEIRLLYSEAIYKKFPYIRNVSFSTPINQIVIYHDIVSTNTIQDLKTYLDDLLTRNALTQADKYYKLYVVTPL
jgi:hypothetical protein